MKRTLLCLSLVMMMLASSTSYGQFSKTLDSINREIPKLDRFLMQQFLQSPSFIEGKEYEIRHTIWVNYNGVCSKEPFENKSFLDELSLMYRDYGGTKKQKTGRKTSVTDTVSHRYLYTLSEIYDAESKKVYFEATYEGLLPVSGRKLSDDFLVVENAKLILRLGVSNPLFIIDSNNDVFVRDCRKPLYTLSDFIKERWDDFYESPLFLEKRYR